MDRIIPVILSGGMGSRLWPVSRMEQPKPFLRLADGHSLLQKTYHRAVSATGSDCVVIATNRDYYFMSKDEISSVDSDSEIENIFILEPMSRNTAPAIALAAKHISQRFGSDAIMLVLSADHLVSNHAAFVHATKKAAEIADKGYLVTFGATPTAPETAYGYIECGDRFEYGMKVSRFIEKPPLDEAMQYLEQGNFLWNTGMFCFKAGVILDQMAEHAALLQKAVDKCWANMNILNSISDTVHEVPADKFHSMPNISIDNAVMERSDMVVVIPVEMGWSDIGSWNAISQLIEPDENNNRSLGEAVFIDSNNVYTQSQGRMVAAVGVSDVMIIDTPDALLVAHTDKAQDVKKVVDELKTRNHDSYKLHTTVMRPWGAYTVLEEGPRFKIKRIEVKPGGCLSLQMHQSRSEHWVVVSGTAKVTNNDNEMFVGVNESTFIPAGHKHRLENPGNATLVMIEVQSGEYVGEDDIVRFDDIYGRDKNHLDKP